MATFYFPKSSPVAIDHCHLTISIYYVSGCLYVNDPQLHSVQPCIYCEGGLTLRSMTMATQLSCIIC